MRVSLASSALLWAVALVTSCTLTELPEPTQPGCEAPLTLCGTECIDLQTATEHCGSCDALCARPGATAQCVQGECTLESCEPQRLDCDANEQNGCEVSSDSDSDHCGACDVVCTTAPPNASASCTAGECVGFTCDEGFGDCNNDQADGCEITFSSDPLHCGVCDRDCLGGACTDGVCEPALIATGQANVLAIAANAQYVFWTTYQTTNPQDPQGGVQRANVTTLEPEAIISGLCQPTSLAINQSSLFVLDPCAQFIASGLEDVIRANLNGSLQTSLSDGYIPRGRLALTDDSLYFFGGQPANPVFLLTVSLGGGQAAERFSASSITYDTLHIDDNNVYYFETGLSVQRLKRTSLDDDSTTHLWVDAVDVWTTTVLQNDLLYGIVTNRGLLSVTLDDANQIGTTIDPDARGGLAADATHVYYGARTGDVSELRRSPIAGGAPETVVGDLDATPTVIAVNDSALYWTEGATISRLAK